MKQPKLRPRNPLVAIAIARGGAGAHDKSTKARRRKDRVELQRELHETRNARRGETFDVADHRRAAKWHRQGGASAPLSLCRVAPW